MVSGRRWTPSKTRLPSIAWRHAATVRGWFGANRRDPSSECSGSRGLTCGGGLRAEVPVLWHAAGTYGHRSGHVASVSDAYRAASAQSYGAVLSSVCTGMSRVLPRTARGVCRIEGDIQRQLWLLLVLLRELGRACQVLCATDDLA